MAVDDPITIDEQNLITVDDENLITFEDENLITDVEADPDNGSAVDSTDHLAIVGVKESEVHEGRKGKKLRVVDEEESVSKGDRIWVDFGSPINMRVLVVDSSRESLDQLWEVLSRCRYTVTEARTATSAVNLTRRNPESYDVVLTNLEMPDMGLREFLVTMRDLCPQSPLILLSSKYDFSEVREGMKCGAWTFMKSPLTVAQVESLWAFVYKKQMSLLPKPSSSPCVTPLVRSKSNERMPRFRWDEPPKRYFSDVVKILGPKNATPKKKKKKKKDDKSNEGLLNSGQSADSISSVSSKAKPVPEVSIPTKSLPDVMTEVGDGIHSS